MPIYRANYKYAEVDYVEAPSHYWAKKQAAAIHPDWTVLSVEVAKEMKGVELTDWNRLVLGNIPIACASCGQRVLSYHAFSGKKDVEKRPCHDEAGNVFCKVPCRDDFQEKYGGSVKLVEAMDFDTWANVKVPVPTDPEKRKAWEQEWTLVNLVEDKPVLIATHRYESMIKYQPHAEFAQEEA